MLWKKNHDFLRKKFETYETTLLFLILKVTFPVAEIVERILLRETFIFLITIIKEYILIFKIENNRIFNISVVTEIKNQVS